MLHGNYTASDRNNLGLHGLAIFTEYEIYFSSSTVAIVTIKNPQPPHGIVYYFSNLLLKHVATKWYKGSPGMHDHTGQRREAL